MSFDEHADSRLISVVMPCHDAAAYVEQAVTSALGQSHGAVELIVVDDGSTDDSPALLAALARRHPEALRVLSQPNRGPYPARNLGLRHARGRYVAFLDADDYWDPHCLSHLHGALERAGADVAYCGWRNVGVAAPADRPYVPPAYEETDAPRAFLESCPWPIHAALVRRTLLDAAGGFSERCFTSMDYDLWIRVLGLGARLVRVPEVLAYYRWHGGGQISAVKWRQVLDAWQVRRDFVARHPGRVAHLDAATRRALVDGCLLDNAYRAYWQRDLDSARRLFQQALRTGHFRLRDLKYLLPSLLPARVHGTLIRLADGNALRTPTG